MKKTDILVCRGEAHTALEWCAIKGITVECLRHRLDRGMHIEKALDTPSRVTKPAVQHTEARADRNCTDCCYSETVTLPDLGRWTICDYMGRTGKRRPCPYGDGCTVKQKKEEEHDKRQRRADTVCKRRGAGYARGQGPV